MNVFVHDMVVTVIRIGCDKAYSTVQRSWSDDADAFLGMGQRQKCGTC